MPRHGGAALYVRGRRGTPEGRSSHGTFLADQPSSGVDRFFTLHRKRLLHERVLRACRQLLAAGKYVVTLHAIDELEADGFTVLDLEHGILTGAILEVQRDRITRERKFRIRGTTQSWEPIEQVVKLGPTGMLVVITVYRP